MDVFISVSFFLLLSSDFSEEIMEIKFTHEPKFLDTVTYPAYIDKTLLIKHMLEAPKIKMITAPRKFGKSTNLDMLSTFLNIPVDSNGRKDNKTYDKFRRLFKRYDIYKKEKTFFDNNFGMYPVLHTYFQFLSYLDEALISLDVLKVKIRNAFKKHKYLRTSEALDKDQRTLCQSWCDEILYDSMSPEDVRLALRTLTHYLYLHFNRKVVVLVDDYDDIAAKGMFNVKDQGLQFMYKLMISVLKALVIDNPYVELAILTGVSNLAAPILKKENIYEFLEDHPLVRFYGFEKQELDQLLIKFERGEKIREMARNQYEGYVSKKGLIMYNPYSLLNFLQFQNPDCYWTKVETIDTLKRILEYIPFEKKFKNILGGECVRNELEIDNITFIDITKLRPFLTKTPNFIHRPTRTLVDFYFKYLFELGYLGFGKEGCIKVPNKEIEQEFTEELVTYYTNKYNLDKDYMKSCSIFFNNSMSLHRQGPDELLEELNYFYRELKNILIFFKAMYGQHVSNKADLENIMCVLSSYAVGFNTKSQYYYELPNKDGRRRAVRLDVFMYKGSFAIIIEVNHRGNNEPNSLQALHRILDGKYYDVFEYTPQKIEHYVLIGLSVNDRGKIAVSCLVDTKNMSHVETVSIRLPSHYPEGSFNHAYYNF